MRQLYNIWYNWSKKTNISHCQLELPLKTGEIFFKQKTDISQLEPSLIMAGVDKGVFTKLVLVSAAGAILESTPLYVLSRWKTNISQLESPLKSWQVQMKVSLPKLVLLSAAGDDMIVVISINATEEGGKCQKNQRLLS